MWFRNRRNKSMKKNKLNGKENSSVTPSKVNNRMAISPHQLKILKKALLENPCLDALRRQKIAKKANMSETRVIAWFGNNRRKMRANKIVTKSKTEVLPQRGAKPAKSNRPTQRNKTLKQVRFSSINKQKLENSFNENQYPNAAKVQELAVLLNVTKEKIQVWFQNRRVQWKKGGNKTLF